MDNLCYFGQKVFLVLVAVLTLLKLAQLAPEKLEKSFFKFMCEKSPKVILRHALERITSPLKESHFFLSLLLYL